MKPFFIFLLSCLLPNFSCGFLAKTLLSVKNKCLQTPMIENGHFRMVNATMFQVDCNENFKLSEASDLSKISCTEVSGWDLSAIKCLPIKQCGQLPLVDHGKVTSEYNSYEIGAKSILQCDCENFTIVGNNAAICDTNGQWTSIGKCQCGQSNASSPSISHSIFHLLLPIILHCFLSTWENLK